MQLPVLSLQKFLHYAGHSLGASTTASCTGCKTVQVFRMLVVRDMEGTFVVVSAFGIIPQGQKQLRWAWEGAERSHHTPESECLYVTCLGLP